MGLEQMSTTIPVQVFMLNLIKLHAKFCVHVHVGLFKKNLALLIFSMGP